jgi:hypothetical protein
MKKIRKLIFFLFRIKKRSFFQKKSKVFKSIKDKSNYKIMSFGNKNKNKIFYVIKRIRGGGLFSNFLFVLNHLAIADKLKFTPIVDMENFDNFYTEKKLVNNSKNTWEHLFAKVSKYSLKEVYKSKLVVFSDDSFFKEMSSDYKENTNDLLKVYKKYIKVKPFIYSEVKNFVKKNFSNQKILGVHWRGTDHQTLPNHPYPPTKKQIITKVNSLLKKHKYTKIFLITEDKKNFDIFLKYYGNKVCFYNSFRTNKVEEFDFFNRKNHRYNLGKESLIEVLTLSKLNRVVCSRSNISEAAIFISKNKKYKVHEIYNGFSINNIIAAFFGWHILSKLPYFLGGFKTNPNINRFNNKRI